MRTQQPAPRICPVHTSESEWSRLLLVEGVPGVGKSTLLDALLRAYVQQRPARQLRTLLHLTQAHTYGPLAPAEDAGALTRADALAHLDRVVRGLEWAVAALASEHTQKLFVLVDTLHLTHCHRPGAVRWPDVAPLDGRLAALGCRLVFLQARRETLRARTLARSGTQFLEDYARRRWGPSDLDLVSGLVREQAEMLQHLAATRMPTLVLEAEDPIECSLDAASRFWLERP
jgi:adenylate kinase